MLTRGADAVGIQDAVPPDGLAALGVQHGTHHLVKRLVGVALQSALGVLVDQTSPKACEHQSHGHEGAGNWRNEMKQECYWEPELTRLTPAEFKIIFLALFFFSKSWEAFVLGYIFPQRSEANYIKNVLKCFASLQGDNRGVPIKT